MYRYWDNIELRLCQSPPEEGKGSNATVNDPSAGSPTETLLRLLLPLNDQVRSFFQSRVGLPEAANTGLIRGPHNVQSVVAASGVYKGEERNQ